MLLKQSSEKTKTAIYAARDFFGIKSPLAKLEEYGGPAYEYRPQQTEMAEKVSKVLEGRRNLCVEAPTGVGKSFAYLVPAIYFALSEKFPVLISTETINLQEQLVGKDMPLLQKILELDFDVAIAKGRSNYLCRRRFFMASGEHHHDYLPLALTRSEMGKIAEWAELSEDGSLSTLNFAVDRRLWESVCCELGNCAGSQCNYFKKCFYWKVRRQWDKADIIIANHALFFTDLRIKHTPDFESTLLPPYSAVILDEAHLLEDRAAQHLGLHISSLGLHLFLKKLFDPESGKGLLLRAGEKSVKVRNSVAVTLTAMDRFFGMIREKLFEYQDTALRIRKAGFVKDVVSDPLAELEQQLNEFIKIQEDEDYKQELIFQIQRCQYYHTGIFNFINMELPEHVYWIEKNNRTNSDSVQLYASPLNINVLLRDMLFGRDVPVILTSATLSVRNNLDYYCERVGFINGDREVLGSPFDYDRQVRLYIPRKMPLPDEDGYLDAACEQIRHYIRQTHGKAFVLFTSYEMMKKSSEVLRSFFEECGIQLMIQGEGKSRTAMLCEFRRDIDSVIFGTTSFWTGVDVPGESLSNVIITKLPFAVPTHPLIQARVEKLEGEGKPAFVNYQLPEAVLKFRQGIGRLIRTKSDKGIIVILDRRVISKHYGKFFLDSIPRCPIEIC